MKLPSRQDFEDALKNARLKSGEYLNYGKKTMKFVAKDLVSFPFFLCSLCLTFDPFLPHYFMPLFFTGRVHGCR